MSEKQLSTQPNKGMKDLLPDEFLVQEFMFNTWKEVCLRFGYKEYQTPLLESAEIYRAKSGEDVGGKELYTLTDLGGRELAIRPEMTPSVTRLVAKVYKESPKPIRFFNVSNFCRNEKPQKGRNREFWQLNADIFGDVSINSDLEILSLALELMLAFNPPEKAFKLYYNNRKLINAFLDDVLMVSPDKKIPLVRLMDKFDKYDSRDAFVKALVDIGFDDENVTRIINFLTANSQTLLECFPELESSEGTKEIIYTQEALTNLGYAQYIEFKANIIRGFDYYDGLIFEVFDANKENPRSLFGGGRYNGLAELFGIDSMPAVGFAPGSETFRIFLENWDLIPELNKYTDMYYLPLLENVSFLEILEIANKLRKQGYRVQTGVKSVQLSEGLREANKLGFSNVIIVGVTELAKNEVQIKNMQTGEQKTVNI